MFRNLMTGMAMASALAIGVSTETFAQQTDAKQDADKAGTEAKQAGKSAGAAAKDAGKATAKVTTTAAKKTAQVTTDAAKETRQEPRKRRRPRRKR
jgi:hypothetical protein